jgi:protein involved in polysaccharide export with SLBB domain
LRPELIRVGKPPVARGVFGINAGLLLLLDLLQRIGGLRHKLARLSNLIRRKNRGKRIIADLGSLVDSLLNEAG